MILEQREIVISMECFSSALRTFYFPFYAWKHPDLRMFLNSQGFCGLTLLVRTADGPVVTDSRLGHHQG